MLARSGRIAIRLTQFHQLDAATPKPGRLVFPSAVFLTLTGISMSVFSLRQLESSSNPKLKRFFPKLGI